MNFLYDVFQAKMKLLTFMQLAETKSEITFGEIQQHMQLGENEVEEFLIDRKCFCRITFNELFFQRLVLDINLSVKLTLD